MGAAASVPSKEGEGSVFEALKAQEETKTFYRKRIAEVIVKVMRGEERGRTLLVDLVVLVVE